MHHVNCGTLRPIGGRVHQRQPAPFPDRGDGVPLPAGRNRPTPGASRQRVWAERHIDRLRHVQSVTHSGPQRDSTETTTRQVACYACCMLATRPRLDPAETALRQVAQLGYSPERDRHPPHAPGFRPRWRVAGLPCGKSPRSRGRVRGRHVRRVVRPRSPTPT